MSTFLGYEHVGHQLNISVALGNNYVIQYVIQQACFFLRSPCIT